MIRISLLIENRTDNFGCDAECGLSVLVENGEKKVLFDTGSSDMFKRNAKHMKIDLEDIDAVVISHGHFDHTNGVPEFCRINKKAKVYVHKNGFGEFYGSDDGVNVDDYQCGILWSDKEKKEVEDRLVLTDGPLWLTENIVISGTIPDVPGCVPPERFFVRNEEGVIIEDDLSHEQFMAVRDGDKGIYIFSGCSHKGVIPAIEYAKQLFPGEKITGLLAGMHLYGVSKDVRKGVVDRVAGLGLDMVIPVHCTGIEAICMLKTILGPKCTVATAGDIYEY